MRNTPSSWRRDLVRPMAYYLPIKKTMEELKAGIKSSVLYGWLLPPARRLSKNGLRPSRDWFDSRKNYVRPKRNPTLAPTPSSKGRAVVGKSFSGGAKGFLKMLYASSKESSVPTPFAGCPPPPPPRRRDEEEYNLG